jgi:hypothetical protein
MELIVSLSTRMKQSAVEAASIFARPLERLLRLFPSMYKSVDLARSSTKLSQLILMNQYASIRMGLSPPMRSQDVEFRAYSQNGEDGILLYIFSLIGFKTRLTVEICAGDGIECNTANLIINHSCYGLLVDGNQTRVERARHFYSNCPDTCSWPPKLVNAWVDAASVNALIEASGFAGEIDLLSIDVDGMDYWIWREINVIQPRVVVVEFNHLWGPKRSVTVPYDPRFTAAYGPHGADYCGASLAAMVTLAAFKGYRLVAYEKYGFNAFFLRKDLAPELLPDINLSECFAHPRAQFGMQNRFPSIAEREWSEV